MRNRRRAAAIAFGEQGDKFNGCRLRSASYNPERLRLCRSDTGKLVKSFVAWRLKKEQGLLKKWSGQEYQASARQARMEKCADD